MKVYQKLAYLVVQHQTCIEHNNTKWMHNSKKELEERCDLFTGGDIESCEVDLEKSNNKLLVLYVSFRHISEWGYNNGVTNHTIRVRPALTEIEISVSGKDTNGIKAYLRDTFANFLNEDALYKLHQL